MIDTINLVRRLQEAVSDCRQQTRALSEAGISVELRLTSEGIRVHGQRIGDNETMIRMHVVSWATITNSIVSPLPAAIQTTTSELLKVHHDAEQSRQQNDGTEVGGRTEAAQ